MLFSTLTTSLSMLVLTRRRRVPRRVETRHGGVPSLRDVLLLAVLLALLKPPTCSVSSLVVPWGVKRTSNLNPLSFSMVVDDTDSPTLSDKVAPSIRGALSLTVDELAQELGGYGRARLAWDCYSIGIDPQLYFEKEPDPEIQDLLPTCRKTQTMGRPALERLKQVNGGQAVEGGIASLSYISRSADDTTKLLLRLEDGVEVETVVIPWNNTRSTLCISSQVGCRQACTFCNTGRMGMGRSLSSDEILAQMFFARKICRLEKLPPVTNIVFMGMGEPADNVDAVVAATKILTTRELFQLSASKVTVSTVGPTPESFSELSEGSCVLAWSVHAANNKLRKSLVPTTKHTMEELREGLISALLRRQPTFQRTTMLEVTLIEGVNDSTQHAQELAEFSKVIIDSVPKCKLIVNLIPYNPAGRQDIYQKPSMGIIKAFQQHLWTNNIFAHVRTTRGDDEQSACGQLATTSKTKKKSVQITATKV